jgi:pyruvate/2-oxoacid:ferredoxin oxidoreductase beta subunit/Pyruvate/2-oxoacid:ferredoxin oxidoreductase gamma subunit
VTITITPLATFRNEKPYPFCPGCGHGQVLDALDAALVRLDVDPAKVVIVSDIGCAGLSDQYFATSAFHGLHGRSITYATGIKLADPALTVVVVMGDGGTGIGGAHLLSAARRNIGITVVVMNNLNFGMTGGQHSTTTPEGAITSTTPGGNLEHPLDICATVGVNGAGYVYRGTSFDGDLTDRLVTAIRHPGFALLDIWELCTAYYVRANRYSRRGIEHTMAELGFSPGVLYEREVGGYTAAYAAAHEAERSAALGVAPHPITVEFGHALDAPATLLLAGSAGGKVRSAGRVVAEAGIRAGLWVTQKDDYPVTVKTGHSTSQLTLSPVPAPLLPVETPDAVAVLSDDGLRKVLPLLGGLPESSVVFVAGDRGEVRTPARTIHLDPGEGRDRIGKQSLALAVAAAVVAITGWFEIDALEFVASAGPFAEQNAAAVTAGLALTAR